MKRTARDNRERYTNIAKPVEKVELNEKKPKARLIATICLGVVGAGFLSYAFVNFLNKDEGWTPCVHASFLSQQAYHPR